MDDRLESMEDGELVAYVLDTPLDGDELEDANAELQARGIDPGLVHEHAEGLHDATRMGDCYVCGEAFEG